MTAPLSKKKKPVYIVLIAILAVIVFVIAAMGIWGQLKTRLSVGAAFGGSFDRQPARTHYSIYDVEPQVVYRLDDDRYIELSNYAGCQPTYGDDLVAEAWYYDKKLGIKTRISSKIRNYQGRIINADPSGRNLVFPITSDRLGCSERGCGGAMVFYSTDYGRTLSFWDISGSGTSYTPSEDSKKDITMITEKELISYGGRDGDYFFVKIMLDGKTIDGEPVKVRGHTKSIPPNPVLMDRYQCDANIKPKSVGSITVKEYDAQRRPYFEQLSRSVNRAISALDRMESWQVTLRTHYAAYDVAPQVIYRLDDSRYVELSNYGGCLPSYEDEKVVEVWYHDLNRNIKTRLFSKMRNYQGRVINADPSGKNLAFPVTADRTTCAEEKCGESVVYYSTDYGKTFKPFFHFISGDAPNPLIFSKEFTSVITNKELMVYRTYGHSYKFIKVALDKENENEVPEKDYGRAEAIPFYPVIMDSYQCDANIKPKHVGGISVEEYNRQKKGN